MRRILTIITLCILAVSCGQTTKNTVYQTRELLHREFIEVMLDSTVSWKQITDVVNPFVDSLCVAAADETNINNRIYGQEWGYVTIEALSDKYMELEDAGKDVNYDDVPKILEKIANG